METDICEAFVLVRMQIFRKVRQDRSNRRDKHPMDLQNKNMSWSLAPAG